MVTLEKIDQVVERTGVTYEEARAALEEVGGDVLEAIIYLETTKKGFADNMSSNINDKKETIMGVLKDLISKNPQRRCLYPQRHSHSRFARQSPSQPTQPKRSASGIGCRRKYVLS